MVVTAGWLGITSNHPTWRRVYAVVFGFGGGLIGDEVGLLLTFGNYHSQLTYVLFIGLVCFVTPVTLLARFRANLQRDLLGMERGEATVHVGLVIACSSALPFAFDFLPAGSAFALAGIALAAVGIIVRGRHKPDSSAITNALSNIFELIEKE